MTTKAKRGKISPYQLFFILFVSRIVVTLTYVQSMYVGQLSSDLLISILFAFLFTMLLSIPAYLCSLKHKNPLSVKWISVIYSIYFIYFAAVSISRFSYFAARRLNPESTMIFFAIIITAAACYAAIMGIESIGRFGIFCGSLLIFALLCVIVFDIKNVDIVNFYPVYGNSRAAILQNSVFITSNSIEPVVFLALSNKINGQKIKPLFLSITAAFIIIFVLLFFCIGVIGSAASLQSYPIFTLFQMASFGSYSRLDILYISFWVFALFLKGSVLIYCASTSVKKYTHRSKCVALAVVIGAVTLAITEFATAKVIDASKIISLATFCVLCFAVPLIYLFAGKRRKGDEIIESI